MTEQEFRNFLSLGLCIEGLAGVREQWETLFEGTLTTEASTAVNGCSFTAPLTSYGGEKYAVGDTVRLTVNGVPSVFVAHDTGSNAAVGNDWLRSEPGADVADTGYDYCFSVSTNLLSRFWFRSRNPGTYTVKIERMVTG